MRRTHFPDDWRIKRTLLLDDCLRMMFKCLGFFFWGRVVVSDTMTDLTQLKNMKSLKNILVKGGGDITKLSFS